VRFTQVKETPIVTFVTRHKRLIVTSFRFEISMAPSLHPRSVKAGGFSDLNAKPPYRLHVAGASANRSLLSRSAWDWGERRRQPFIRYVIDKHACIQSVADTPMSVRQSKSIWFYKRESRRAGSGYADSAY